MKVLVIGGGGREHALAWKLGQSPQVDEVIVAPGNAGTAREPGVRNADVAADDLDGLLQLAKREKVGLTVVGPEVPLVAGVVDRFRAASLRIFGPRAIAAQLEGSKAFAKDFLQRHNIPTAHYAVFTELNPALAYVREQAHQSGGAPIVIKADGLAAGKGVVVALTLADAELALHDMLGAHAFGDASARVVIEEFLDGEEASYIVMSDGSHALPMASSQDHKRRDENDLGPNTGGMGAYSPAPVVTPEVEQRILKEVIEPTLRGMAAEGAPFIGFLYAGLMIDKSGAPKVIEFNVRFGDPETQPILLRLKSDLVELIDAALDGRLEQTRARWDARPAIGVVMAAGGYPGRVRLGDAIDGLDVALAADVKVFHAGTRLDPAGRVLTTGGRVLTVCALGSDLAAARESAYAALGRIHYDGAFCRRDIAHRALHRR
ncbi:MULTISPECIES: phosphoribosylamine--glycine ligase [Rhodanobacter]|uniref:Phosphoribosylamine--glycine ligase n=1 Tax=Rhodanobacter denitrificans TaxID=666685 RepID=M4NKZ1_9GAMM|nr:MULTISPECIES: phosphoribosylamine--glycine ligase [Rhodanobacter]AGG90747.1 phosphoribosylamine--glycine ligase [Rhodanobacter denitrificans]KZC18557.1 phosphoribosylamine--glycine ligase [Rhodanobacter denitrificans]UJJ50828.1 phosphoribosylamine--glycine ligase [Rhodanobacter denitrificans]UJJ56972.1 phosphoribosylamine--glycine ligase [Rhodanobacter denitrificans]UJM86125.1 phosphoribosylamine--glycine ligase [Rhodanobacter denitrificans]